MPVTSNFGKSSCIVYWNNIQTDAAQHHQGNIHLWQVHLRKTTFPSALVCRETVSYAATSPTTVSNQVSSAKLAKFIYALVIVSRSTMRSHLFKHASMEIET